MSKPLSSCRVVLLEDEPLVALDLEDMLIRLGVDSPAVVGSIERALEMLEAERFDLAILDLNIRGEVSLPVADCARNKGVPIIFATGYELEDEMLERYDARRVGKPYSRAHISAAIKACGFET